MVIVLFLAGRAGAQDAVPPETLARIKASTVFVKAVSNGEETSGSGFVFRVDAGTLYIATNHHVVTSRNATRVSTSELTIVFDSGTKAERSARGTLLVSDPERDLAVVKVVGATNPPRPIDLSTSTKLVETMPVITFGFPFGRMLSTSRGSPSITVGRGAISSIRTDDAGEVVVVQIDGALNPGNSGGPVVGVTGNLIGVAVATIRDAQQIGLVIPRDHLTSMLEGRAGRAAIRVAKISDDEADLVADVNLFDPLQRITDVAILFVQGDVTKAPTLPTPSVNYKPLPGSQRIPMRISGPRALALFSLAFKAPAARSMTYQIAYTNGSGKEFHTKPELHEFVKSATVGNDVGANDPIARRPPIMPRNRLAPAMPPPASGPSMKIDEFLSATAAPKAQVAFTATVGGFLKRYDYPDFALAGSYKLPGPATQLAIDPVRKRLYAVVLPPGELKSDHPLQEPYGKGDLHVFDIATLLTGDDGGATELTPVAKVPLGANVIRMILSAYGRYLFLLETLTDAKNPPAKLVRVDTQAGAADLELDLDQGATAICVSPSGKSLYVAISPRGHEYHSRDRPEEGTIYLVGMDNFEVVKKAMIELDPSDIQANDQGLVYVAGGSNQHTSISVVDMKKSRAIVARWPGVYMGALIRLAGDQKRLFVASRHISPSSVVCWLVDTHGERKPQTFPVEGGPMGGGIYLTPDDAFLMTRLGAVIPVGPRPQSVAKPGTTKPEASKSGMPRPRRLTPR